MMIFAPVGLSMLLALAGDQGGALVGERTDGLHRVCSYENQVRGRLAPPLDVSIGLAEPCPFRYPRPRRERPPEIPSLATLEGRTRANGQTVCRYVYLGIRYDRAVPDSISCPYTPNFSE